jgi:pimeloyl-ACP methyl ester carboxylesterase
MFTTNPNLIQDPPLPGSSQPTPLILIHDGGGTIFSYYCLGDLGRSVHGIANPHYESGQRWEGGIPEMARHYLSFVRDAVPNGSGDVILGGWSLGGLVALELARLLESTEDPTLGLRVVGIVMVDSVCPVVGEGWKPPAPFVPHAVQWSEFTQMETREKVTRCFEEARRMVDEWTLPVWEGGDGSKGSVGSRPPPVVLLRAMEAVPVEGEGMTKVDAHRSDRQLGWGKYRKDLVTKVIDIPGHHFNIFHTDDTLDSTTEGIKKACVELETINDSRASARA